MEASLINDWFLIGSNGQRIDRRNFEENELINVCQSTLVMCEFVRILDLFIGN